jgi:1-acyl-sn-glycerol-3-phosphate acyltransferase
MTEDMLVGVGPSRAMEPLSASHRPSAEGARSGVPDWVALAGVLAWGAAEALWWPLMPDLGIALLARSRPRRWWRLAVAATAGSVAGGAVAYRLGADGRVPPLPLVTPRMVDATARWLAEEGAAGVRRQPTSGVPFKVFAYQAAAARVELVPFVGVAGLVRGARMLAVAGAFAGCGQLIRRRCPEHLQPAASAVAALLTVGGFAVGLSRVVAGWSGDSERQRED